MSANVEVQPAQASNEPATQRARDRSGSAFLLPAAIWVLAFSLFPLIYAIYNSFWSFRFGRRNAFVGLTNYERLFTDANLHNSIIITLILVVTTVTIEMTLGFALALLLNRDIPGRNILRAVMILPLFATPVALGYLGITIYYETNGPINLALRAMGFENIPWLSNPFWAKVAIMIIDVWQWTPFVFLVALAGLQSLPQDLFEAAAVDGAGAWATFRRITLPLMAPTLWLILLLRLVDAFKVFDIPQSLTLGGPGRATEVYSMFTYRTGMRFFDHGYAAAQGFLLLLIVSIVVSILFGRIRGLYEED